MKDNKSKIEQLINVDPLSLAEKVTGKSYKEDDGTTMLGMGIQMDKSIQMERLMDATNDTKFSEETDSYISKIEAFGFEKIYEEEFDSEGTLEKLYVFFHREYSILLNFYTYRGSRNGGDFYYNWIPNDRHNRYGLTSSGSMISNPNDKNRTCTFYWNEDLTPHPLPKEIRDREPILNDETPWDVYRELSKSWTEEVGEYYKNRNLIMIWKGSHDCREAVAYKITNLHNNGTFLKYWKKNAIFSLAHHGNWNSKGFDYEKNNERIYAKLPKYVQEVLGVK